MKQLLISDLHLTANPRDDYRWGLFPWLRSVIVSQTIRDLFILGDLTEAKDYHSAKLVNRIADNLISLYRERDSGLFTIWVLRGNHDGIDPTCPFFRFLRGFPFIKYVEVPYMTPINNVEVLMLPHTTNPVKAWEPVEMHAAEIVLLHATVRGALAENGQAMEGIPPALLRPAHRAKIYSGDVHVPQKIGPVEYVGAPYPIRFGDSFRGRAIMLEDWRKPESLFPPTIQRRVLTIGAAGATEKDLEGLDKDDQVKVRVQLSPAEYGDWGKAKARTLAACAERGVVVCGMELLRAPAKPLVRGPAVKRVALHRTPTTIFDEFCAAQDVDDDLAAAGKAILRGVL